MPETNEIPVPDLADPNFAPFWEGTRAGRLVVQACAECGKRRWPPRVACLKCHSTELAWEAIAPRGTLYSFTIVGRPTAKGFSHVPYTVGIVELADDPGVRIVGTVIDIPPAEVAIGQALEGRFVQAGPAGEMTLIHWAPARA